MSSRSADDERDGSGLTLAAVAPPLRADWDALYSAYADFYGSAQTPAMRDRVWAWLADPAHELAGLIALDRDGQGVGLVNFRPFSRPLAASVGGFIDDLYVAPDWRGRGVADRLVEAVAAEGRRRGWAVIRWITDVENHRARAFYARVADETRWVTYQIPL